MMKIFHNLHLKILSLLAAVLLWIFVVGIENNVLILPESLDVKPLNMAKSVSLATALPQVKIYVKVDQNSLKTINKNDFELSVDLAGLTAGDYQLPVQAESKNPQATVLKTEPAEVYVHLAPLAEKEVPVVALYKGAPMAGFSVKEIKTDTHTVTVSAAQNILDKIQQVKAEIILNGSEDTNISQTVQLAVAELSDVPKESIHINPSELSVTAIIVPQLQQKTVMIKPDITGNGVTDELTKMVEISPAQAAIQGEAGDLASIEFVQTIPLELTLLQRMDAPFEIGLTLPEGVTLVNPQEVIKVMLKKADATPGVTEESAP